MIKRIFCFFLLCASFHWVQSQYAEESIALKTDKDSLRGTLIMPAAVKKFDVIILHAGSGPTDRNGNNPLGVKANSYRLLAQALAAQGIATCLFDKRGIGASAPSMTKEADLRFETYVQDLTGWINKMSSDKRVDKIIVTGHSEGSLIGMLAAQQTKVQGYISISGPAESIDKIITTQLAAQMPKIATQADSLFTLLKQDKKIDSVPPYLLPIFRPSLQPYIKSWMKYSPCDEIKKLTIPLLIIQGTADIQVAAGEAKKLAACNTAAALMVIDGMNHVLKNGNTDPKETMANYGNAALPVNEHLVQAITNFIKSIK